MFSPTCWLKHSASYVLVDGPGRQLGTSVFWLRYNANLSCAWQRVVLYSITASGMNFPTADEHNHYSVSYLHGGKSQKKQLGGSSNLLHTNSDLPIFPCRLISSSSNEHESFVFTAMLTQTHSHRVVHCGRNGCVQLCGVKQVIKTATWYSPTRPEPVRLLAWLSPACLPACLPPPSPSNGTNYPATWVK